MFTTLALLAGLVSAPAEAGVHVSVAVPGVRVVIDPWAPGYRPGPRAGWAWVDGYRDSWGNWVPGYWVPSYSRVGYTWVPGYWEGRVYVDGYWRPASRVGYRWVDGYYSGGRWIAGRWSNGPAYVAHHDRVENFRDDRREYGHREAYAYGRPDNDGYDGRGDGRGSASSDGRGSSSGEGQASNSSSGRGGSSGEGQSSNSGSGRGGSSGSSSSSSSGSGGTSRDRTQAETRHGR